jgi:hypothetical protein
MSPAKAPEVVKLNLRLPKSLHRQLVQAAKQNGVSLNTQIISQLGGPPLPDAQEALLRSMREAVQRLLDDLEAARKKGYPAREALLALVHAGKITPQDGIDAALGRLQPSPERKAAAEAFKQKLDAAQQRLESARLKLGLEPDTPKSDE